jgi:hypothetical protein
VFVRFLDGIGSRTGANATNGESYEVGHQVCVAVRQHTGPPKIGEQVMGPEDVKELTYERHHAHSS